MKRQIETLSKLLMLAILAAGCYSSDSAHPRPPAVPPVRPIEVAESFTPQDSILLHKGMDLYHRFVTAFEFNGSFLLAKNGRILFEKYKGFSDFGRRRFIDSNTAFHVASVSKTFTAVAILRLWEIHRLSLNDNVRNFIPEFPYRDITIKMLLAHRSGLPDYLDVLHPAKARHYYTNKEVIRYYIQYHPHLTNVPGSRFHYSNFNFVLLAEVLERITHEPFAVYLNRTIFVPLGMHHTFVGSHEPGFDIAASYTSDNKIYPGNCFDLVYGDKNIYSTLHDLFTWDKALYSERFINRSTLDTAFQPVSSLQQRDEKYGLGWRLICSDDDTIIYHTGWWHGNCSNFVRHIKDSATLIILSNRYNRHVFLGGKTMLGIMAGTMYPAQRPNQTK